MGKITVVGLDPSLSNFGMVRGTLDLNSSEFQLTDLLLSETAKTKIKSTRKNSDDLARARTHSLNMLDFTRDTAVCFVEIPVGSQSARSMASYGVCIGLLAGISVPLVQVTPAEVKFAATGSKTASKQDMIDWATGEFPLANWLSTKRHGETIITSKNEHLADALAAIKAGVSTDQFQAMKSIMQSMNKELE